MIISGASGTVDPTANRAMDIQPYSMLLEYSQFHRGRKTSNDEKSRMIDLRKFVIAAQTGRSFQVARGEYIRVIDPEGQQVADLWALTTDGEIDWLSTSQTRDITERLFPSIGESFYSYNAKPMLTLVEDESSGPHDMLFPACNHDLYVRAGLHEHPNCRDNLLTALRNENIRLPVVPDPVNFFQNSPPNTNAH
jgi:uncharacterized protein YcgI (DUF1989 family)